VHDRVDVDGTQPVVWQRQRYPVDAFAHPVCAGLRPCAHQSRLPQGGSRTLLTVCGIVGYVGPRQALDVVLEGLRRLEYRGYDSAGVAVVGDGLQTAKKAGRIENLDKELSGLSITGTMGMGHTRWATHGAPTDRNAHPHLDAAGRFAVVHNGI